MQKAGAQLIRIVVTGSECTGKSTLAALLAEHYSVPYAQEFLREYFIANNGVLTLADAVPVAKGQLQAELDVEAQQPLFLLCDTNMLSSVVYNKYYYKENPEWIEAAFSERSYDLYLLCGIDVPWTDDGQRDRPQEREYMQSLFRKELDDRCLPYIEVQGAQAVRLSKAVAAIDSLLAGR
ncbi:NadR-like protein [Halodesulfovibrio spirochaetisodalis]|uniref:NadR-like protein n=2 Tax=Halodesulfovibrio spirochaetisodalis TaxID=1560234 RepID=A0A1B7XJU7_9BACT|nr:NadR-like protein [Halodesulfovibrio spirochaetisodalis]